MASPSPTTTTTATTTPTPSSTPRRMTIQERKDMFARVDKARRAADRAEDPDSVEDSDSSSSSGGGVSLVSDESSDSVGRDIEALLARSVSGSSDGGRGGSQAGANANGGGRAGGLQVDTAAGPSAGMLGAHVEDTSDLPTPLASTFNSATDQVAQPHPANGTAAANGNPGVYAHHHHHRDTAPSSDADDEAESLPGYSTPAHSFVASGGQTDSPRRNPLAFANDDVATGSPVRGSAGGVGGGGSLLNGQRNGNLPSSFSMPVMNGTTTTTTPGRQLGFHNNASGGGGGTAAAARDTPAVRTTRDVLSGYSSPARSIVSEGNGGYQHDTYASPTAAAANGLAMSRLNGAASPFHHQTGMYPNMNAAGNNYYRQPAAQMPNNAGGFYQQQDGPHFYPHMQQQKYQPQQQYPGYHQQKPYRQPPPAFNLQANGSHPGMGPMGHQNTIRTPGPQDMVGPNGHPNGPMPPFGPAGMDPFHGPPMGPMTPMPPAVHSQALVHIPAPQPQPPTGTWDIRPLRSKELNALTAGPGGRPTFEQATDPSFFPFVEAAAQVGPPPANRGVVKIKNMPFSTTRAEIIGILGRNACILNDADEPVHIIMERVSSKTNDAYVEFLSMPAAIYTVEKGHKAAANGRLMRLGDRPVSIELSSQAALMKDLFPLAKGIRWDNANPIILPFHPNEPWSNFKGFVSEEEMTMLVKHVEVPQRSPFSKDCPQRPYECMISTLKKLPWHRTELITIRQRHAVYNSCITLISHLQIFIRLRGGEGPLNQMLLNRLVRAAMSCPGLTVVMKDSIALQARLGDQDVKEYCLPRFASSWVHAYTFAPKPRYPFDLIEWYIAVIREETERSVRELPFLQRSKMLTLGQETDGYFGFFWYETGYPYGPDFDVLTLADVAMLEFNSIEQILRRALVGRLCN